MTRLQNRFTAVRRAGLTVALAFFVSACTSLPVLGGTSWKEEVLLHDGSKIIVKRSQDYGGLHEIGQSSPVREHTISFSLPGSTKTVSWTSEYGEDIGRTNFNALALHVVEGTPYLVVEPNLCLSYNKWGRPNPPYVLLRYDSNSWQRISLTSFPVEFNAINLIVNIARHDEIKRIGREQGYISAERVQEFNGGLIQPEYRSILRLNVELERSASLVNCEEMVRYECGWGAPGEFNRRYFERVCK